MEGFPLVGGAEAAAEIKDGIVIVQGQGFQETLHSSSLKPSLISGGSGSWDSA